jgi:hypothetical protein
VAFPIDTCAKNDCERVVEASPPKVNTDQGVTRIGGPGTDSFHGGSRNHKLLGGGGDDFLDGEGGADVIWGDHIPGSSGNDVIQGGPGDDTIFGNNGTTASTAGPGRTASTAARASTPFSQSRPTGSWTAKRSGRGAWSSLGAHAAGLLSADPFCAAKPVRVMTPQSVLPRMNLTSPRRRQ